MNIKFFLLPLFLFTNLFAGEYFQQDVSYKIDVELIPAKKSLFLQSYMSYTNNSPDTLKEIYVRLYWNIFCEDSYARKKNMGPGPIMPEVVIKEIKVNNVVSTNYQTDNTVMKIPLKEFVIPGRSVTIEISLEEEVSTGKSRMGRTGRNYSIAHWFPAVCVYDKNGWQTDQYLGRGEFNEEIGNYEINLTLPSSYLVFHTGYLVNPDDVLPADAVKNLNEAMTTSKRVRIYDQTMNTVIENDSVKKTWKLRAENVRTFAFTAFEDRLWDAQGFEGTLVHTVYKKDKEDYYTTDGIKAAVHAVKYFSAIYGKYIYPNVFVCASENMSDLSWIEYPGITFVGASSGGGIFGKFFSMAIIHEIAHNWCPMTINSNETKYAFMDEGFTDYFTMQAIEEFYGKEDNMLNREGVLGLFLPALDMYNYDYIEAAQNELAEFREPVIKHSDRYLDGSNYTVNVYQKTSMILSMLRFVIGEEAFFELFREYYNRFKLKHVYPEDFFNLAEEMNYKYNGKKDLSWFFDEWFYKTARLDYALNDFDYDLVNGIYKTTISIERIEETIMPAEIEVELEDGTKHKELFEADCFLKGPSVVNKTFEYYSKPVKAGIDPDNLLLEINKLNNSTRLIPPVSLQVNPLVDLLKYPHPDEYTVYWFPAFSFNNIDGVKFGLNLNGTYFGNRKNFELTLTQGTKFGKGSFGGDITLSDNLELLGSEAEGAINFFNYEGRRGGSFTLSKYFTTYNWESQFRLLFSVKYFDAYDERYFDPADYDLSSSVKQRKYLWFTSRIQNTKRMNWMSINSAVVLESGFILSDMEDKTEFQKITFSSLQKFYMPLIKEIRLREYLGYSPGDIPSAMSYYLATVNPIEQFSSYIYRTPGIIPASQERSIPNGGAYMRGYFNQNYSGNMVTSLNFEMKIGFIFKPIPIIGKILDWISPLFFADAGNVWTSSNDIKINNLVYDYGFSLKFPLYINAISGKGSNVFSLVNKLGITSINFDFPLYVSKPVPGEDKFMFRWLFGFQAPF